ncbi:MAG: prolipoprotein diacylglyceryl transferase [Bacteroidota bacterium]
MFPRILDIPITDSFSLTIFSFGFMVAVAILTAAWLTGRELDRRQSVGQIGRVTAYGKPEPKRRKQKAEMKPSQHMGTITVLAAAFGIGGSKLFHILENLDEFFLNPVGMLFSTGGLTFYGGLICAGLAIAYYVRKVGIPVPIMADAVAPGLMLAYGIGRIGCYLAGDGDWGVCSDLADKPAWIPGFLWSETFPDNVLGPGQTPIDPISYNIRQGDTGCVVGVTDGVFPTMLYEFAMASILFGVLWALRKKPHQAGWLFGGYLLFAGLERLLIERIRVNNEYDLFGLAVSQAEVISVVLILAGAAVMAWRWGKKASDPVPAE